MTEQEIIAAIIADPPVMCAPSTFALYSDDCSTVVSRYRYMCHRALWDGSVSLTELTSADNMINAVPRNPEFIQGLIDGPFRLYKDRIELLEQNDGKWCVKMSKLDTIPAPVVLNFSIATRIPFEHPYSFGQISKMVKAGVNFNLAMLIGSYNNLNVEDKDPWAWVMTNPEYGHHNGQHYPLDLSVDWVRFISGDPIIKGRPFFKDDPKNCHENNCIWGSSKEVIKLKGLTVREIHNHFVQLGCLDKENIHEDA